MAMCGFQSRLRRTFRGVRNASEWPKVNVTGMSPERKMQDPERMARGLVCLKLILKDGAYQFQKR
jgi:hypothetical protein